jgi:hypothetical protein
MASVLAGQAAALLTQPADTVKTLMQADRGIGHSLRFQTSWDAVKHLYHQPVGGGVGAFWRGIVPRSVRCMGAVFILGEVQARLVDVFDTYGILKSEEEPAATAAPPPSPSPSPPPAKAESPSAQK